MIQDEQIIDTLSAYRDYKPSEVQLDSWSSKFILFAEELSVTFDGFKAVDIPCYGIHRGELRVIIGPNGAGKTTFCDLVSGKTCPSTGKVYFDGKDISLSMNLKFPYLEEDGNIRPHRIWTVSLPMKIFCWHYPEIKTGKKIFLKKKQRKKNIKF